MVLQKLSLTPATLENCQKVGSCTIARNGGWLKGKLLDGIIIASYKTKMQLMQLLNLKLSIGIYIMNNQTFEVPIQFIIDALQARYNNVKELWGSNASQELWEQALQMVEECGIGDNVTSPSIFVDSYLLNGEFVSKDDDKQYWLGGEYDDLSEDDKEFYECEAEYIEQKWQEYVTDNACLYNDNYACLSF